MNDFTRNIQEGHSTFDLFRCLSAYSNRMDKRNTVSAYHLLVGFLLNIPFFFFGIPSLNLGYIHSLIYKLYYAQMIKQLLRTTCHRPCNSLQPVLVQINSSVVSQLYLHVDVVGVMSILFSCLWFRVQFFMSVFS
jgi:hypothetical protein